MSFPFLLFTQSLVVGLTIHPLFIVTNLSRFTQSHFGVASSCGSPCIVPFQNLSLTGSTTLPVLVIYDAVLTFPKEVRCIWMRRFSGATVIYILVRYSGLALALLDIQQDVSWNVPQTDTVCALDSSAALMYLHHFVSLVMLGRFRQCLHHKHNQLPRLLV